MVARGAGPARSAFLSSFFTLAGTHGAHGTSALTSARLSGGPGQDRGLRPAVLRRLLCWSLFWHALDVVWVSVLTLVYLMGGQNQGAVAKGLQAIDRQPAAAHHRQHQTLCVFQWNVNANSS